MMYRITPVTKDDSVWIKNFMTCNWGGEPLVIRSKKFFPSELPGLLVRDGENILGFLFYIIENAECEIIVFEIFEKFHGIGTAVLNELIQLAKAHRCQRIFLMTTNDNLDALRFYQRRGFHICRIHIDSITQSRKLKPTIGLVGDYNIPLRDEIDLEMIL